MWTNEYTPDKRLKGYGFTDEDIERCESRGFMMRDISVEIERLLNIGATTEGYAKETFFEAHVFQDGHMNIDGTYLKADGSLDFISEKEESA